MWKILMPEHRLVDCSSSYPGYLWPRDALNVAMLLLTVFLVVLPQTSAGLHEVLPVQHPLTLAPLVPELLVIALRLGAWYRRSFCSVLSMILDCLDILAPPLCPGSVDVRQFVRSRPAVAIAFVVPPFFPFASGPWVNGGLHRRSCVKCSCTSTLA